MMVIMIIVAIVFGLIAVVVILAALRPDTFEYRRSRVLDATPEAIMAELDDFRRWTRWSPWEGLDPALQRTYGPIARGPGATYAWKGNRKAGAGQMTITGLEPAHKMTPQLEFTAPFKAVNTTEFTLDADHAGTRVTWTMRGKNTFVGKLFSLVFNMEKFIGKDFDRGLEALGRAVSTHP